MNIGNRADALKVYRADRAWLTRYEGHRSDFDIDEAWEGAESSWGVTLPNDVSMVGSGAFRRVWTVDGEVAYKVGRDCYGDEDSQSEWANYKKYANRMPEGFRLPHMTPYIVNKRFILAVELIKFPRQANKSLPWNASKLMPFEWYDCGPANYRTSPDGTFILLDFAC